MENIFMGGSICNDERPLSLPPGQTGCGVTQSHIKSVQ